MTTSIVSSSRLMSNFFVASLSKNALTTHAAPTVFGPYRISATASSAGGGAVSSLSTVNCRLRKSFAT